MTHLRKQRVALLLAAFAMTVQLGPAIPLRARTLPSSSTAQPITRVTQLKRGQSVKDTISGGQSRSYLIRAKAGQFVHVIVEQEGIYVTLALFDSTNKKLAEMDSLNGAWGPEALSIITPESGAIRLEIAPGYPGAAAGQYEARLTDLRSPTAADRARPAAERSYMEGLALYHQGDPDSKKAATSKWQESFDLWRTIGDQAGEAMSLRSTGVARHELGESQGALDSEAQALLLYRALKDRGGEAKTLNSIGLAYKDLGEKQKALDYFNQALPLRRAVGDRDGEAATLNDIGLVYSDLGDTRKALDHYNQALPAYRAVGDRGGEAATLNNIGIVYSNLGDTQKALDDYNQALPVYRAVGDGGGEAATLNNIGNLFSALGESEKALDYYGQALPAERAAGDRDAQAWTLTNIGVAYDDLGESEKALDYYGQALPLFKAVQDSEGERLILHLLMEHQTNPALAIFFGTEAVDRLAG